MSKSKVLLKFADDENYYKCEIQRMSEHMVKVSGLIQDLSGFQIFSDSHVMIGDYSKYVYEYDNPHLDENVFEYTDNGAVYPSEGKDKSLKETLLDELKAYTQEQNQIVANDMAKKLSKESKNITSVLDKTAQASDSQLAELQMTIVDIYATMQEILVALNNSGKTTVDETEENNEEKGV